MNLPQVVRRNIGDGRVLVSALANIDILARGSALAVRDVKWSTNRIKRWVEIIFRLTTPKNPWYVAKGKCNNAEKEFDARPKAKTGG